MRSRVVKARACYFYFGHRGGGQTLGFSDSNKIVIRRLTSLNSKKFHMVINGCHKIALDGVRVLASGSPNTYGAHVQLSSELTRQKQRELLHSSTGGQSNNKYSVSPRSIHEEKGSSLT
ncbi:hypothetical protein LguiA_026063 [Lonicera macranthoides]